VSTCGKCKYWVNQAPRPRRRSVGTILVGDCDLISTITGTKLFDSGHGMDISVTADDDSGLWSELKTGEHFGCINFQPKGA
jgi:hypothetical protein